MKPYREWLAGTSYEAMASLGGSFVAKNIEDYYLTPYDLGYGVFVRFDHEFVGRKALEKLAKKPSRRKVTLAWNGDDVRRALGTLFSAGRNVAKYIDLPLANYATLPFDKIVKGGKTVGLSTYTGYSFNERSMLSLAVVDEKHAKPGHARSRCSGARKTAARRSRPSSGTSRSRFGRRSDRCRTATRRARRIGRSEGGASARPGFLCPAVRIARGDAGSIAR